MDGKGNNRKGMSDGIGTELGGGGGGGLRGVVCCNGDTRISISSNCMPSQGDFFSKKCTHGNI